MENKESETTMDNNATLKEKLENTSLRSLIDDPSQLADIFKNPTKGLDFYNGLSVKEQQYILFSASAGLFLYALYLGRKAN